MAEIEGLVRVLREGDDAAKVAAATALFSLARYNANRVLIAEAGGIPLLVELLRDGSAKAKAVAARALGNLACNNAANRNDANQCLIAEAGAIPLLVKLLSDGSAEATRALQNLACNDDNQVLIAEAGGIPPLVKLLRNGDGLAKRVAAQTLGNVAWDNDANAVVIATTVGLEAVVELARRGSLTVDNQTLVSHTGIAAKRKAALVVAALLRACVPDELRSRVDVQDVIRGVIGPYL
jgi:vacuolar protein 8